MKVDTFDSVLFRYAHKNCACGRCGRARAIVEGVLSGKRDVSARRDG